MANADLIAPMPLLDLGPGMIVRLEAIDATTGLPVAGVTISNATLYAEDVSGLGFNILPGPPLLANLPHG